MVIKLLSPRCKSNPLYYEMLRLGLGKTVYPLSVTHNLWRAGERETGEMEHGLAFYTPGVHVLPAIA